MIIETFSTITMFTRMEYNEKYSQMDLISDRTVGTYPEFETACDAVMGNACDICETVYDYALVQELEIGLYPMMIRQKLFKVKDITIKGEDGINYYNFNCTYEEIEIPEKFIQYGFCIG